MRKVFVLSLIVVSILCVDAINDSRAIPSINSCDASLIGFAVTNSNLAACRNADPPRDCTYEQLANTWAIHQVLINCFGTEL